jgi:hypothetical protein
MSGISVRGCRALETVGVEAVGVGDDHFAEGEDVASACQRAPVERPSPRVTDPSRYRPSTSPLASASTKVR